MFENQAGIETRRQMLRRGLTDNDIERLVRRRERVRIATGVYVDHTGPLTWEQRAWGALLGTQPSALADESALAAWGVCAPPSDGEVTIVVPEARGPIRTPLARVVRLRDYDSSVHPARTPSVMRIEPAALRLAARRVSEGGDRPDAAVAVLTDACRSRLTSPGKLRAALAHLPRLRSRSLLADLLNDVGEGAESVLEHRYVVDVERRHGLPQAQRQMRDRVGRRTIYRDLVYAEGLRSPVCVELDGSLGHSTTADRWRDLERDLSGVADDLLTVRLTWAQVLQSCRTAAVVARVLAGRGWTGSVRRCPSCPVGA